MSGENCRISFRIYEGRCEYQVHKDDGLVARFGPDFDDFRRAKQDYPAATLDQTFDPQNGVFPAQYPREMLTPKSGSKNKNGKVTGIVHELPPEDPRSMDHPCHREQWLELARALGRGFAQRQFAFEDEFNSLLPLTKVEARLNLERLKTKYGDIVPTVDEIMAQLDDPVTRRIQFSFPEEA